MTEPEWGESRLRAVYPVWWLAIQMLPKTGREQLRPLDGPQQQSLDDGADPPVFAPSRSETPTHEQDG